jgi:hypothetical protein
MKPGDIVKVPYTKSNEPEIGFVISCYLDIEEWGEQIVGECDCLVFWNEEMIPMNSEDLIVIS